jgi:hypothetical protein
MSQGLSVLIQDRHETLRPKKCPTDVKPEGVVATRLERYVLDPSTPLRFAQGDNRKTRKMSDVSAYCGINEIDSNGQAGPR